MLFVARLPASDGGWCCFARRRTIMETPGDDQVNQDAYWRLKDTIARTYPPGRFVAIAGGQIVGDAAEFLELHTALLKAGYEPRRVIVVQAGVEYPRKVTLFLVEGSK
jgi:hypothetical protein